MVPCLDHEEILFFEGQLAAIVADRGSEAGVNALFAMMVAAAGLAASCMGVEQAKAQLGNLIPRFVDLGRARDVEMARLAAGLEDAIAEAAEHTAH